MKAKDCLDKRGIKYKDIKESSEGFNISFEIENEKDKAIRALVKDDCMITSETRSDSGWKISGFKKKDSKSLEKSSHTIEAIRAEIIKDIK